jgi:hypothetical protein
MAKQLSLKQLAIIKDNSAMVLAVGITAFLVIFSLVAANSLLKQSSYQSRVINKKKQTLKQIKTSALEIEKLQASYQVFADADENVLKGNAGGNGDRDGENPRLVLDALPSKYDFPALATSLDKLFGQYGIEEITGTDDEVAQSASEASSSPQPVEMPFSITMNSSANASKEILQKFERSIRPVQIQKITFNSTGGEVKIIVDGKTFFQPQKKFDVRMETVK